MYIEVKIDEEKLHEFLGNSIENGVNYHNIGDSKKIFHIK